MCLYHTFITSLLSIQSEDNSFLIRNGGTERKVERDIDAEKDDYEARLDKLACPKCKKVQSFDEFNEKQRECGLCKERFAKVNVVNMNTWQAIMKENEQKRKIKIANIEKEVYSDDLFKPAISKSRVKNEPTVKILSDQNLLCKICNEEGATHFCTDCPSAISEFCSTCCAFKHKSKANAGMFIQFSCCNIILIYFIL